MSVFIVILTPGTFTRSCKEIIVAMYFCSKCTPTRKMFKLGVLDKSLKPAFIVMVSVYLSEKLKIYDTLSNLFHTLWVDHVSNKIHYFEILFFVLRKDNTNLIQVRSASWIFRALIGVVSHTKTPVSCDSLV